jgi:selenocysteine lyase/cysteine desulfurase
VPTICFTVKGMTAASVASQCAKNGVGIRDGNMYSPRLLRRMGIPLQSGALRASLVHYNTIEEIDAFVSLLQRIAAK